MEVRIRCLDCDEGIALVVPAFDWLVSFLKEHSGHKIAVLKDERDVVIGSVEHKSIKEDDEPTEQDGIDLISRSDLIKHNLKSRSD